MQYISKRWKKSIAALIAAIFVAGISLPVTHVRSAETPNTKSRIVRLDEKLGVKPGAVLAELSAHEYDRYYLGTPYDSDPFTKENCMRPNGAYGGNGGMNCTGFVASVFEKCGADLSPIENADYGLTGGKINASNWLYWIIENAVENYHYQTIDELLQSGKAKKGDVIYFEPISWNEPDADCHIGFFWGNSGNDNKFWHSATKPGQGNQISELTTKSPSTVYLFKITSSGDVEVGKSSGDPELTEGNHCYSLEGAEYTLYKKGTQEAIAVITTDGNGYGKVTGVEAGVYDIKETKAPKGYARDTRLESITVKAGETVRYTCTDTAKRAVIDILVEKCDAETGEKFPQGGASFAGAEFVVKYYDVISGQNPALDGKTPVRTWRFRTDEEGKIRLADEYLVSGDPLYQVGEKYVLPLGTVTIQEVKAPEGYRLQDGLYVQTLREEASQVGSVLAYQETIVPEEIMRGDLELIKVGDGTLKRMKNVPFKITSKTTGESHVIVTDQNGYVSTSAQWNLHTRNTNQGTSSEDGVWFGDGTPDDGEGALPYDTYLVEELECEENADCTLIPPFEVQIYKDTCLVKLGTLTNDAKRIPEIATSARDQESGTHQGIARKEAVIVDEVSYKNLMPGTEYTVKGILMNAETGEKLLVDGKDVTAEKTFVPENAEGNAEVQFMFDATELDGVKTVVFETLYCGEEIIAVHADIHDPNQTVAYEKEPKMPEEPEKPEEPKKPEEPRKTASKTPDTVSVKTGDGADLIVLILSALVSCVILLKCATMGAWRRTRRPKRS